MTMLTSISQIQLPITVAIVREAGARVDSPGDSFQPVREASTKVPAWA